MSKDLSQLVEYLDGKFTVIDQQFADMRAEFLKLQDGVDGYAKKADSYFQEMLMLASKVDRHEKWLHQMAEKLGVKLEY